MTNPELAARTQAGVTTRRLAEAAGVNHGLVHYYFGLGIPVERLGGVDAGHTELNGWIDRWLSS